MIRWGILGCGKIAHLFAQDLLLLEGHQLMACGSRSEGKASAFASKYKAVKSYGQYEALIADEDIDIIYIATPHDSHYSWAVQALEAGRHVLCEKPLAVNSRQVSAMIAVSQASGQFLMEAFWSRFNPSIHDIITRCHDGDIGEVNYINAEFSFLRDDAPDSRMLNMDRAGGSLLDMGVYPVFLAYSIMGVPAEIKAVANFHDTGADLQTAMIFKYENGMANLMSGFTADNDMIARVCGDKGRFTIDRVWHETQGYTATIANQKSIYKHPTLGKGFTYEIKEAAKCIQNQLIESPLWSHQNSLDLITIIDEVRRQCGLKYPFE